MKYISEQENTFPGQWNSFPGRWNIFPGARKYFYWGMKYFSRARKYFFWAMKFFSWAMKSVSGAMKYEKSRFRRQWNMSRPVVNSDQHFRSWLHDQLEKILIFLEENHPIDMLGQTTQLCKNHINALMCQSWIWNGNKKLCWIESIPIISEFGPLCRTDKLFFFLNRKGFNILIV